MTETSVEPFTPFRAVAVMKVFPLPTHVIIPRSSTVATEGSELAYVRDVTAFYEADYEIYSIPDAPSSEIDNVIGQYVSELVRDGDTIQLGIGSLPNACARNLMDKRDLGIHSEMFTNLMKDMIEKGVLAVSVSYEAAPEGAFAQDCDINGKQAALSVKR